MPIRVQLQGFPSAALAFIGGDTTGPHGALLVYNAKDLMQNKTTP